MPVIVSEIKAVLFIAGKANQWAQAILAKGKNCLCNYLFCMAYTVSSCICKY